MTIDSHQHFWNFNPARDTWITGEMQTLRRDFLPDELSPLLRESGIEGSVAVQADQSEKETEFLIDCARNNQFIKAVVGWTDLRSPGAQARLEYYHQFDVIKGFRHIVQAEADDFLLQHDFQRGVELLEQYDYTYDILIYPRQLPAALKFIKTFPNQSFVIDHLAKPQVREGKIGSWKSQIMEAGQFENVHCKLSGLVTEADWNNWSDPELIPYLEIALEAFGPSRLMYGSDWPVCLLAAEYKEQLGIVKSFINQLTPSEKRAILGENARRFYHI